ncbi:unnamed protein product, partial [Ectocarpus sp. 13 AM-2016]
RGNKNTRYTAVGASTRPDGYGYEAQPPILLPSEERERRKSNTTIGGGGSRGGVERIRWVLKNMKGVETDGNCSGRLLFLRFDGSKLLVRGSTDAKSNPPLTLKKPISNRKTGQPWCND